MAQKELSGWDTHVVSGQSVDPSLSNVTTPPACVTELVQAGRFGIKTGAGFKLNCEARLQAALRVLSVAPVLRRRDCVLHAPPQQQQRLAYCDAAAPAATGSAQPMRTSPGSQRDCTWPPCMAAIALTMARPSPAWPPLRPRAASAR